MQGGYEAQLLKLHILLYTGRSNEHKPILEYLHYIDFIKPGIRG